MEFLIANILITGVNVVILGLTVKLYTEYYKDKSIGDKMRTRISQKASRQVGDLYVHHQGLLPKDFSLQI